MIFIPTPRRWATSAAGTTPPLAIPTTPSIPGGNFHRASRETIVEKSSDLMAPETLPPARRTRNDSLTRVNIILFDSTEIDQPLARSDRRAAHLLTVLRRGPGDSFDAGIINGAQGKATLCTVADESLTFLFTAQIAAPLRDPVTLVIGLPRPQTARDILRDATTLGVAALHFVLTEKGERGYAQSTLWSTGEWRRHVIAGAEQAFATAIPDVTWGRSLAAVTTALTAPRRLALDNYESPSSLRDWQPAADGAEVVLAIGGERGWANAERALLRLHGFEFFHLGPRALRTETACTAALAIVRTKLGLM